MARCRVAVAVAAGLLVILSNSVSSWAQDASPSEPPPLKIFILAGQSNMQGHARVTTFDAMRLNPQAAPILAKIRQDDGSPTVCSRVWISSIGSSAEEKTGKLTAGFGAEARGPKIGPEFTFGIYAQELFEGPILIIKTAWGGKSLHTDFRPPGAPPYEFNEQQLENLRKQDKDIAAMREEKKAATGVYYRQMIEHIDEVLSDLKRLYPHYDPDQGHELAGFVWFQGWNDMVDRGTYPNRDQPGGYKEYSELLAQFIRDVRADLDAPDLPFVIGVMGVGGPTDQYAGDQQRYKAVHQNFRDAMAAPAKLAEFKENVAVVLTEEFWDMQVVSLRRREAKIKPQVNEIRAAIKEGTTRKAEGEEAIEELYRETFTKQELEILRESTSNFDFHYMGSAGIISQIGKAFAETVAALNNVQ